MHNPRAPPAPPSPPTLSSLPPICASLPLLTFLLLLFLLILHLHLSTSPSLLLSPTPLPPVHFPLNPPHPYALLLSPPPTEVRQKKSASIPMVSLPESTSRLTGPGRVILLIMPQSWSITFAAVSFFSCIQLGRSFLTRITQCDDVIVSFRQP